MEIKRAKCYTKLWKYDRMLYSIGDIKLIVPVSIKTLIIFLSTIISVWILANWFSVLNTYSLFSYGALPVLMSWALQKPNPEGKTLHRFLIRYMLFVFARGQYNRFQPIEKRTKYNYSSTVSYRKKGVDH
ncbi:TcpE family conjugal transfer membrane protein [Halobacillus sp. H74]|uniref:TcpE family conjugal transfer membrane protein n=1 Tax=Halobacillus sp. H74 TaxID=3457436 RepID=UPI003FCC68A7